MIKAVIFDVDGTLLDSFEANFELFRNLMKQAGYQPPTKDEYIPLFHRTMRDTVKIIAKTDDEHEIRRICDLINIVDAPPPIVATGAPEAIEELSKHYVLAVVTSRIKAYAYEPPLNTLEHFFRATVAYEDTENHKPHPEPLLLAADQLKVRPEECVYIGDVENDLMAARAAGMKFILYSKEEITGADACASDFGSVVKLVRSLS